MNICQLDEFIVNEIQATVTTKESTNYIESIINSNIKAFTFANKPIENLTMYVVIRHIGEAIVFKTLYGKIVKSKLDMGYVKSRELFGLEQWNVNKIYKVNFGERGTLSYTTITLKQLSNVLNNIIEPYNLCYTVKIRGDDSAYHTIRVDKDLVGSISYPELLKVITKAYTSALEITKIDGKLDIYLVDYIKN